MKNQTIEALYSAFIQGGAFRDADAEKKIECISERMDELLDREEVNRDTLTEAAGEYEDAARRAGFYAGFKAAMELFMSK